MRRLGSDWMDRADFSCGLVDFSGKDSECEATSKRANHFMGSLEYKLFRLLYRWRSSDYRDNHCSKNFKRQCNQTECRGHPYPQGWEREANAVYVISPRRQSKGQ